MNLKIKPQIEDCFNWSMAPSQSELVVFARVSDPAVDLETTPPDGPWLEATCAAVPWSLGVDVAIWNAVGASAFYFSFSFIIVYFLIFKNQNFT